MSLKRMAFIFALAVDDIYISSKIVIIYINKINLIIKLQKKLNRTIYFLSFKITEDYIRIMVYCQKYCWLNLIKSNYGKIFRQKNFLI